MYIFSYLEDGMEKRNTVSSAEELVTAVQKVLVDPRARNRLNKGIKDCSIISIGNEEGAEISAGALLFNKASCQTRIARGVNLAEGLVEVYNNDDPVEAEKQELGEVTRVPEYWNTRDCIVLDLEALKCCQDFWFGSPIGRHEQYLAMQLDALGLYT